MASLTGRLIGADRLQLGTRGFKDDGGYDGFIKYMKKHGKAISERGIYRSQRVLMEDLHTGSAETSNENEKSSTGKNGSGVSVTLTGNATMHAVELDACVEASVDAESLSSLLTRAAQDAFTSSQQSVLALGLDIGSKLGYHYPTADMLYPDRFANLKASVNDDEKGDDEKDE